MVPLGIRQLECFIAVAEERHVGRAAARLHMTQPPLTRRMAQLERDVGATLFRRTSRGVELTVAGDVLLERGYRIIRLAEQAVERTRSAGRGSAGELVVGYSGATVLDLVPSALAGFLDEHPHVSLTLVEMAKADQPAAVREGRIHIAFGCYYPAVDGIAAREVVRESLAVAVPSTHRLAGRPSVEVGELGDEDLVLHPAGPRPSLVDDVIAMFAAAGVVIRSPRLVDKTTDALVHVATTGVCAVVPRAAKTVAMRGVSFVPLRDSPKLPVDCVYAADDPPAVVREFLAHLDRLAETDDRVSAAPGLRWQRGDGTVAQRWAVVPSRLGGPVAGRSPGARADADAGSAE